LSQFIDESGIGKTSTGIRADIQLHKLLCEAFAELHIFSAQAVYRPKLSSLFTLLTSHYNNYLQHSYFTIYKLSGQGRNVKFD